jgi:hypothetical protein
MADSAPKIGKNTLPLGRQDEQGELVDDRRSIDHDGQAKIRLTVNSSGIAIICRSAFSFCPSRAAECAQDPHTKADGRAAR